MERAHRVIVLVHGGVVRSAVFSPDGKRIVTASEDRIVRVWSPDRGGSSDWCSLGTRGLWCPLRSARMGSASSLPPRTRLLVVWRADGPREGRSTAFSRGTQGLVRSAVFSPDGEAGGHYIRGQDGPGVVGRRKGGAPWFSWGTRGRSGPRRSARIGSGWSPPRRTGQPGCGGAEASRRAHRFRGPRPDPVRSAAFDRDGRYLLTSSDDGTARVWRIEEEILSEVLEGYKDRATFAAFSPDGMLIATASQGHDRTVLDGPMAGEQPASLAEHEGPVLCRHVQPR